MGRKSRLKKERKEAKSQNKGNSFTIRYGVISNPVPTLPPGKITTFSGEVIYRFFQKESYAEAFSQGKIRLSTLESCRGYEDPRQGDKKEGVQAHMVSMNGSIHKKDVRHGVTMMNLPVMSNSHYSISDTVVHRYIPDAYVLCTTETYEPSNMSGTFGDYCVKIEIPEVFFNIVTMRLEMELGPMFAKFANVEYKIDFESMSDEGLGFTKEPDQYADQKEVRMLWLPSIRQKIKPSFTIDCPEVSELCKVISLKEINNTAR